MAKIEETHAIVTENETYEGKVIPTRRAEIDRPVTIHENATVTEGVYGQSITIAEDAVIDGPIMAQEAIEFNGGTVTADVGTQGKVTGEEGMIFGTIVGTKITLEDCIVHGNIVGQDILLENCLVFGVIVAERNTELRDTICYTFKSFGEGIFDETKIVLPQAVADGDITLKTPVSVLAIPDALLKEDRDGPTHLTRRDLYMHDDTQYLTLAPRLLDLTTIRNRIKQIEDIFTDVVVSIKDADEANIPEFDSEWLEAQLNE